jgi:hypothetical protein
MADSSRGSPSQGELLEDWDLDLEARRAARSVAFAGALCSLRCRANSGRHVEVQNNGSIGNMPIADIEPPELLAPYAHVSSRVRFARTVIADSVLLSCLRHSRPKLR